jgi:dihydroneopterin aldolase
MTKPGIVEGASMGIIRLSQMAFFAHHGALPQERESGQVFQVDVEMSLDLAAAACADDLSQAIDYGEVYGLVEEVVTKRQFHLLEALAQAILDALATRYVLQGLTVRVRKVQPPLPGPLGAVEVELSLE